MKKTTRKKSSPNALGSAYAAAGVNRDAGDALVSVIGKMTRAARAKDPRVKSPIGGYASLYKTGDRSYIAASTDGVGTKLRLAFEHDGHGTVGVDLVAMSVNDLLCVGATPAFFLDYFATGKLKPHLAARVIEGIVEGCRQAKCPLVGGETAEMPGFYADGEYDLAGFAVGTAIEESLLPRAIRPEDVLIGVASSGFHSNGYSLIRKFFAEWRPSARSPEFARTRPALARELLKPTRIYVDSLGPLARSGLVKGMAHITGSGFLNVPRLSEEVDYEITLPPLAQRAPVYRWLFEDVLRSKKYLADPIRFEELAQTFNLGIGMVLAVDSSKVDGVLRALRKAKEPAWVVGRAIAKEPGAPSRVSLLSEEGAAWLTY